MADQRLGGRRLGLKPKAQTRANGAAGFLLPPSSIDRQSARAVLRLRLLRRDYAYARADQRAGLCLRSFAGGHRHISRRPGKDSSLPQPPASRKTSTFSADEERRVPRRRPHAAREDRHGLAQHLAARPGALPHPPRRTPSHRRQVVHLPDVRFRALPERLHRRHHPLDLHARIRGSPPALRLDPGEPRPAAPPAAPIRVRPPQPRLHRDEQAQAHAARQRRPRLGLGRSAHAHHLRACAGAASPPRRLRDFAYNIGITKYQRA